MAKSFLVLGTSFIIWRGGQIAPPLSISQGCPKDKRAEPCGHTSEAMLWISKVALLLRVAATEQSPKEGGALGQTDPIRGWIHFVNLGKLGIPPEHHVSICKMRMLNSWRVVRIGWNITCESLGHTVDVCVSSGPLRHFRTYFMCMHKECLGLECPYMIVCIKKS